MSPAELANELRVVALAALELADTLDPAGPTERRLSIRHRVLLAIKQGGPARGPVLAARCELGYDPNFRRVLARMCRDGRIKRAANGYQLRPVAAHPDDSSGSRERHGTR